VLNAVIDLAENPNTLLALKDITQAVKVARPFAEYVAPYQTVCNFAVYFLDPLGAHQRQRVEGGTTQNQSLKLPNPFQPNSPGNTEGFRPADTPANSDPHTVQLDFPESLAGPPTSFHGQPYGPAIDAQGNADCQNGQFGFLWGPLVTGGRYPPTNTFEEGGGNHVVLDSDTPGLAGGTFKARELGINNLQDVP
jgi:hypothetical protein